MTLSGSPADKILKSLGPFTEQERYARIAYDGKFDIILFSHNGLKLNGVNFDTLIAAYLLGEKSLKLKALAFNRLGIEMRELSDLTGTGARQIPFTPPHRAGWRDRLQGRRYHTQAQGIAGAGAAHRGAVEPVQRR